MSHWLRGVGGVSPDQGVEFHEAPAVPGEYGAAVVVSRHQSVISRQSVIESSQAPCYRPIFLEGEEAPVSPPTPETVLASEARELFYSWAGDYCAMVGPVTWWESMNAVKPVERVGVGPALAALSGRNTCLILPWGRAMALLPRIGAVVRASPGTRVTVLLHLAHRGLSEDVLPIDWWKCLSKSLVIHMVEPRCTLTLG